MELEGQTEVQKYVDDMEREMLSIKKSHSYRIGKAIIDYYKGPKIRGFGKFIKDIKAATKKINITQRNISIKLPEKIVYNSIEKVIVEKGEFKPKYPFLFYKKVIKDGPLILTLNKVKMDTINVMYHYILPNELEESIALLNADGIRLDLAEISSDPLWRGFGTYEEIKLTLEVIEKVKESNIPVSKRVITNSDFLINYPLLANFIHLFNVES